jgi:hypothetical protein
MDKTINMKKLLLYTLLLTFSFSLSAQETELEIMAPYIVGGRWTGKLTQKVGGISQEYDYELTLTLTGNEIIGKGILKTGSSYGYFDVKGTLIGSAVKLEDVRITNQNIRERAAWCIKNMPLQFRFRNGAYSLEGPWSGFSSIGSCNPGFIYLRKEAIRA